MSENQSIPWSNPYKTKLWLFSLDSNLFSKKAMELWNFISGYGPDGCSDTNAMLAVAINKSERSVKRYLQTMKKHVMLDIRAGWAEIKGGQFVKTIRYRRIVALPWPTKKSWMAASLKVNIQGVGVRIEHPHKGIKKRVASHARVSGPNMAYYQRRTNKICTEGAKQDSEILKIFHASTRKNTNREKEPEKAGNNLSRNSVPNPVSPSGLTGNRRFSEKEKEATHVLIMVGQEESNQLAALEKENSKQQAQATG